MTTLNAQRLARRVIELEELLGEAFDFLGGCDDAAELRDRILAALNGEQTA